MDLRDNPLRQQLSRVPLLKTIIKALMGGVLARQDNLRIAAYRQWIQNQDPTQAELRDQAEEAKKLAYQPLISIITPTYNTPEIFFREMIQSVLDQSYANWELVIVDDASPDEAVRQLIQEYATRDSRIKMVLLSENHHIAGATNEGIKAASGEFVSLFDHDDFLRPNALFEIAKVLNTNRNLDFIYTDEDKITTSPMLRQDPFFKPDWNPDFLHSVNYITHFTTIRQSVLEAVGCEDPNYNGAQDWELFLRVTRSISADSIYHIPKILYSWRVHEGSTARSFAAKPYVVNSQRKAIEDDITFRGQKAKVYQDNQYPAQWNVIYEIEGTPRVGIVLIGEQIWRQGGYIDAQTTYPHQTICVEAGISSTELTTLVSDVDYIVMVNHALHIDNQEWLSEIIGDVQRPNMGFVAARYPRNYNVMSGIRQMFSRENADFIDTMTVSELTRHLYTTTRHNVPVIYGAVICAVKVETLKSVITESEPFDISDLSSRLTMKGYLNLYNPYIKVIK